MSDSLIDNLRDFTDPPCAITTGETRGAYLADREFRGRDFSGEDLEGTNFARSDLTGAIFMGANLRGAVLTNTKLDDCDFTGADMTGADLQGAVGERVGFGAANMTECNLSLAQLQACSFVDADLKNADLRGANLGRARMTSVCFDGVDATNACFNEGDLRDSSIIAACFEMTDLRNSKLIGVSGYKSTSWLGADIRNIQPLGINRWRRFVVDQNYLEEFRRESPANALLYRVWWITSDCGRSLGRWGLCTLLLVAMFGLGYMLADISYGEYETWLSPFYYSVVTMTSLGYGDVLPASAAAQFLAMVQVLVGYVVLGGLISILSNKLARRGE